MRHVKRALLLTCLMLIAASGFVAAQDTLPAGGVLPMPGQWVDVGGHQLHLYCQGEGSPTVILDAGGGDWSLRLLPLQAQVSAFTRTCVYDRAGHGWSEPGPLPADARQAADDLHALLTSAAVEPPFVLVAHSWSGLPAQRLASEQPDLIAGMVLVDARPSGLLALEQASFPEVVAQYAMTIAELEGFAEMIRSNPLPPALLANFLPQELVPADLPDHLVTTFKRQMTTLAFLEANISVIESLAQSEAQAADLDLGALPLIVLVAAEPAESGADAVALHQAWVDLQYLQAAASSDSRVVLVEQSGHYIYVDQPQVVADAILELVERAREQ